ncbi:hypothetical protein [Microcoleus sp. Pol12A5]|uniref:hypothetical protein n=1 Tax=Microcoleus sp. Pol12A5 TaxID=3055392 RepID=UPI002FD22015
MNRGNTHAPSGVSASTIAPSAIGIAVVDRDRTFLTAKRLSYTTARCNPNIWETFTTRTIDRT